jgi:RNA polymerase sigma factor (sigma-70 family)
MLEDSFHQLICKVRGGDQAAATELVRRYEPAIRRAVRFRLGSARLGALLDSMDICQSVLASFFVRAAAGQYDLNRPEQMLKLLVVMARNKLTSQARRARAARRGSPQGQAGGGADPALVPDARADPSRLVTAQELLQETYRRLSPDEQELVNLRNQGRDWAAIAAQLGSSAVVLRKKLSRALDRVGRELGLDSGAGE